MPGTEGVEQRAARFRKTISVVRPVGTGRFVCGHLITTSLTANPSTGIRRRSEPKILMRRRGAAAKWSGSCLSKDRRTRYQIRKANPAARPWKVGEEGKNHFGICTGGWPSPQL